MRQLQNAGQDTRPEVRITERSPEKTQSLRKYPNCHPGCKLGKLGIAPLRGWRATPR